MTPQELKNSILQQAIQGKLVEQRPEEGNAETLYQQIQQEKQRLIQEGKIKKEKPLPEITEEEIPFDIPESWKWCRIGNILHKLTDGTHSTPKYTENGVPFLSVKDMSSGVLNFSNCKYISEAEHNELYLRCNPEYGDLLLTKIGTTGIPVIVNTKQQFSLFVSVALLKFNQKLIYNRFLQLLISSPLVQIQASENTRGVGNKNWVMRDIANTLIMLPPFAEQKRIVAKIEELLPLIDRYEAAWSRLEAFNKRFPNDMKKSLLQEAIQGKLVEQRPEEGTGEELYQQIQEEKARLVAEKKIKKEKPLPEITEEEIPFDIPDSWKWVRLGEICDILNGFTPLRSNENFWKNPSIPWFTIDDIRQQGRRIRHTNQAINKTALSNNTNRILPEKTVLLCCTASVGEYAITEIPLTTNQQFNGLVIKTEYKSIVNPEYLFQIAPTFKERLIGLSGKTTFNFVSVKKVSNILIALPPLEEQKRIVAKLEELLPLCERLK